ncbi:MAG TPA: phosphoenolpyruvate--protein phosphotransferase [Pirellulales bacterium]|jgi:phosphotransferase system enzyme I (PtsI)|nr:phosphoenolpyruvate--protein phosphotransferase [Pirellulales bacterium]
MSKSKGRKKRPPARPPSKAAKELRPTLLRHGVAVSPGVAVGKAHCIQDIFVGPEAEPLDDSAALNELARYDQARENTAEDLRLLHQKVRGQVGERAAAIFQVHESILHDSAFTAKVRAWIVESRQSAQAALRRLLDEYTALFARTTDEYLKERLADVRDVALRLGQHLAELRDPRPLAEDSFSGPVVLVANELVPSHVITLGKHEVAGIVTQAGGRTSHAAILARGRGIPAVSGVAGILHEVSPGDTVVVDGREGQVLVNPDVETQRAYRRLQREFVDLKDHLAENRDQPAVSADGEPLELLANISSLADARAVAAMGGGGVGLYRTEYLFLTHPDVPDEEEQVKNYRAVIAASPQHRVTFRTLDVGGDKKMRYLGLDHEANPFMGWRSIRLSFEHPAFFITQIRAVLRAAAPGRGPKKKVRLMFPMITTFDELRKVRALVRKAARQLVAEGLPLGDVPVGLMLEVPAAAVALDTMLEAADFVSIGSNDLVQYLMAADRDNPKVSHLCQPLSPAVVEVLYQTIQTCRAAGKPVTLCGEMAAAPRAFLLLFGMGLRSFSMSPAYIPIMKELAAQLTQEQSSKIVEHALKLNTTAQIIRYLGQKLGEIAPNLAIVDSAT